MVAAADDVFLLGDDDTAVEFDVALSVAALFAIDEFVFALLDDKAGVVIAAVAAVVVVVVVVRLDLCDE